MNRARLGHMQGTNHTLNKPRYIASGQARASRDKDVFFHDRRLTWQLADMVNSARFLAGLSAGRSHPRNHVGS
jgi:hypothetical protein